MKSWKQQKTCWLSWPNANQFSCWKMKEKSLTDDRISQHEACWNLLPRGHSFMPQSLGRAVSSCVYLHCQLNIRTWYFLKNPPDGCSSAHWAVLGLLQPNCRLAMHINLKNPFPAQEMSLQCSLQLLLPQSGSGWGNAAGRCGIPEFQQHLTARTHSVVLQNLGNQLWDRDSNGLERKFGCTEIQSLFLQQSQDFTAGSCQAAVCMELFSYWRVLIWGGRRLFLLKLFL